jgi:diacylglycerol kinase family enzyme
LNRFDQFLHILNPNKKNRRAVQRVFDKQPQAERVWVERASHPTHLETILEWARRGKWTRIAIWGGDGSFSRAAQWLWKNEELKNVSLALVPAGTGNDFSRTMKLWPWVRHYQRIFSDQAAVSRVDLGLLTTKQGRRVFVNNAGFGRTPTAVADAASHPVRDIFSLRPKRLQVEWNMEGARCTETTRALLGIVFNAPYFNRGLYFDNTISPQDGRLQAVFVPPDRPSKILWRFVKGRWGHSLAAPRDFWIEGTKIEVQGEELLYPQVDGERAFERGELRLQFSVLRDAMALHI